MDYLDAIDEDAKVLGAVNTIVNRDGVLTGYNTDVKGFINGMKQQGFSPMGKQAVLLGAGGAARAIIWGLIQEKVASLTIGVRNVAKVQPLVDYFAQYMPITLLDWQTGAFEQALSQAELLINATPLGMYPKVDAAPPVNWTKVKKGIFVYDIIYTPAETLFSFSPESKAITAPLESVSWNLVNGTSKAFSALPEITSLMSLISVLFPRPFMP